MNYRKLTWIFWNAIGSVLIWLAVIQGNAGALRILDVATVLLVLAMWVMATDIGRAAYWKKNPTGLPFPAWVEAVYDFGAVGVFAYFDHVWLAIAWVLIAVFTQSMALKLEEKEAA